MRDRARRTGAGLGPGTGGRWTGGRGARLWRRPASRGHGHAGARSPSEGTTVVWTCFELRLTTICRDRRGQLLCLTPRHSGSENSGVMGLETTAQGFPQARPSGARTLPLRVGAGESEHRGRLRFAPWRAAAVLTLPSTSPRETPQWPRLHTFQRAASPQLARQQRVARETGGRP